MLAGAALQRGVIAWLASLEGTTAPFGVAFGLEAVGFLAAGAGLWVGGRVALGAALALGVSLAASGLLGAALGGPPAFPAAFGKIVVGALGAAGLRFVVRRELLVGPGSESTGR